tara:strand:+ start:1759 stop:2631 length:873 start_codon:yes stop_codon:yes gene_type:complete
MSHNIKYKYPIIVIGMHRSGTSMLSRILEEIGIFMGDKKDINNEALFFLKFNEYIFKQALARWDDPENIKCTSDIFDQNIIRAYKKQANSFSVIKYLGFKRIIKYKGLNKMDFNWGWKDPRNSFTLNIWRQIYPDAKVIHIYRNPVDVANSLRQRSIQEEQQIKKKIKKKLSEKFLKSSFYHDLFKIQSLDVGYKLWEQYLLKCLNHNDTFNLCYEDLLKNPQLELEKLITFLGLDLDANQLNKVSSTIKSDRRFAFLSSPELVKFYHDIKNNPVVRRLNYHRITDENTH